MKKSLLILTILFFVMPFLAHAINDSAAVTDVLFGDVNGDGVINIIDALIIAQKSVALNPPIITAAADVNCDGSITIVDALAVAQFYVGIITGFPCGTPAPTPSATPVAPTPSGSQQIWGTFVDTFGSTVDPATGNPLINGVASAAFVMVQEPTAAGDYPYAGLFCRFNAAGTGVPISLPITFSYRSTGNIRFSVAQRGLDDNGQAWGYDLLPSATMKLITITESMLAQPGWAPLTPLDLSDVLLLKWEPKMGASGGAASISISGLKVLIDPSVTPRPSITPTPGGINPVINLNNPHTEPLIPKWALGFMQSAWGEDSLGYGNQNSFVDHAKALRGINNQYGIHNHPADIMVLDMYWNGKDWNWPGNMTWDYTRFPDPQKMINDLHNMNFKLMMNYHEGGFGTDWLNQLKRDLRMGLDIVWLDFWNWGSSYEKQVWDVLREVKGPDKRILFMARHLTRPNSQNQEVILNGLTESAPNEDPIQKTMPFHWTGDVLGTWGGFTESIEGIVYAQDGAMGGWSYIHTDTPGHTQGEDPELASRWIQFSDFSPMTRNHGTTGRDVWRWGPQVEENSRFSRMLRYRLLPYIYTYCWEIWEKALPLTRPLKLAYPGQRDDIKYQYMFGEEFLVAPVYGPAASFPGSMMPVYLPDGEQWVDYWTRRVHNGGQTVSVDVSKDGNKYIPLFVKRGAIIPMGPEINWIDPAVHGDPITLDIYPLSSGASSFTLYDDDGESMEYQNGAGAQTEFTCSAEADQLVITVGASQGNYQGKPRTQNYILKVNLIDQTYTRVVNNSTLFTKAGNYQDLLNANAQGNTWAIDEANKVLYARFQTSTSASNSLIISK